MALYEHINDRGEVDERVRATAGRRNDRQLAAKVADPNSGWRLAGQSGTGPTPEQRKAAGERAAKEATP